MQNADILIIGAGAAGLMAAYTLSKAGRKVTVLEARNRIGGRIHTLDNESFFKHAELGAEFVHGNLPVTMQLLKVAGIEYVSTGGEFWQYEKSKFSKDRQFIDGWDILMKKLNKLKVDISIGSFLEQEFGGDQYFSLRKSVTRFVSGYDTADPFKASAFALREEWQGEDDESQYRIEGGYRHLLNYLAAESNKNGAEILLNTVVKTIDHEKQPVKVVTNDGVDYYAEKVIVALPLGVLHAGNDTESAVTFHPALFEYQGATENIGFGAIVKLLLEFKDAFWESEATAKLAGHNLNKMSFILSDEEIPTWWTQYPAHSPVLTGWLGGLPAEKRKHLPDEEFLRQGLQSLANIFKIDTDELKNNLVSWNVANWTTDPFTLGSYVYDTIESHAARKILSKPVNDTIYFAGEYTYEGKVMGTVEAALTSGLEVAKKILA